ncbi:MAG TPA: chromate efflux transporter [Candidatus Limnocylindria bacterium]
MDRCACNTAGAHSHEDRRLDRSAPAHARGRLIELAALFGLLGVIGFGGPAAHVALMRREVAERRRWISEQRFIDLLGITNLLPGPNSTELAMHVGLDRAGRAGLLVAGLAFMLPAALIVGGLAAVYVAAGSTPVATSLLYGVKPVIIAIVAVAIVQLGRGALAGPLRIVIAVGAALLAILGVNELLLLAGGAALVAVARGVVRDPAEWLARSMLPVSGAIASVAATAVSLPLLFGTFLKIGATLYGSGYVLLAFLRADFVDRLGWITDRQLLDAVAIGQVTPGPLFTTATFIGYLVAGPLGAVVATIGIFLPAFGLVALLGGLAARMRSRPLTAALLDGVNAAAIGLMAAVSLELAGVAIVDPLTAGLALAGTILLLLRVPSLWIVVGGATVGVARALLV